MTRNDNVIIGLAAFPLNTFTSDATVTQVVERLRLEGLNAAELLCLSNILGNARGGLPGYPSHERATSVGRQLEEFHVSIHGPYAISLTTNDKRKLRTSRAHMTRCLHLADAVGATHVTFHAGSQQLRRIVKERVRQRLIEIISKAEEEGILAIPAPEVAGKIAGFGNFEEICTLSGEVGCLFCWDFAHDFARGGEVTSEEGILSRLELIEKNIDLTRWRLPVHLSGIVAGRRGEIRHAPLEKGSQVPWQLFLSILREQRFLDKVSIICESKSVERNGFAFRAEQALILKEFIDSGNIEKSYHSRRPKLTQFFKSDSDGSPD